MHVKDVVDWISFVVFAKLKLQQGMNAVIWDFEPIRIYFCKGQIDIFLCTVLMVSVNRGRETFRIGFEDVAEIIDLVVSGFNDFFITGGYRRLDSVVQDVAGQKTDGWLILKAIQLLFEVLFLKPWIADVRVSDWNYP